MPATAPVFHDAIVIGTGQAGPPLARRLAAAGMSVAVVERHRFGGTCVNTGCIPTKAMVACAHAAHIVRTAAEFGITLTGPPLIDMKAVRKRAAAFSGKSQTGVESSLRSLAGVAVYRGHARFESDREVSVGDTRLRADRIFINVGGRASIPPIPGLDSVKYLTNSSMMDLETLPAHLIVVGGSSVGLEFAQMFRRFGSEVTVIEAAPRLLPNEDADISAEVANILAAEGISIRLNSQCARVEQTGGEITACGVRGSHLLIATGRRPNTDDLGLEKAGVAADSRGYITVDDELRTNVPGIWALGDCNGKGGFTHTSYNDFEIVAANLLDTASDEQPRRVSDRIPAYAVYIDPPLGRAGMPEAEVRRTGKPALTAKVPMARISRAALKGETEGFMKITVDAESRQILGAAVLGTGGDEVIHSILDVMYAKAPCTTLQRAMHIHPTVSEWIPTMLGGLEPLN